MILCSCFVVTDHTVRKAAQDGKSWKDLLHETKMGTGRECARCLVGAKRIYDEACPLKPDCKRFKKPDASESAVALPPAPTPTVNPAPPPAPTVRQAPAPRPSVTRRRRRRGGSSGGSDC